MQTSSHLIICSRYHTCAQSQHVSDCLYKARTQLCFKFLGWNNVRVLNTVFHILYFPSAVHILAIRLPSLCLTHHMLWIMSCNLVVWIKINYVYLGFICLRSQIAEYFVLSFSAHYQAKICSSVPDVLIGVLMLPVICIKASLYHRHWHWDFYLLQNVLWSHPLHLSSARQKWLCGGHAQDKKGILPLYELVNSTEVYCMNVHYNLMPATPLKKMVQEHVCNLFFSQHSVIVHWAH